MEALIRKVVAFTLNFFYPRNCIFCNKKGVNICDNCFKTKLKPYEQVCYICGGKVYKRGLFVHTDCQSQTKLDGIFSCYRYNKNAKLILRLIKYEGYTDLINDVIRSMQSSFSNLPIGFDFLVPVPIHKNRFKKRGFNQAELIAKNLTWNYKDILIRQKETKPQAELDRDQRLGNVENAFTLATGANMIGKIVLLLDDVFTTGATLENCATVLKHYGAVKVFAFTWARD